MNTRFTLMLSRKVTIVIPSKNEGVTLHETLRYLSEQIGIAGTNVIIADSSDQYWSTLWLHKAQSDYKNLNIGIIQGGYPSEARLKGSKLVTTPFILFLDADIFLKNKWAINEAIKCDKGLVTVPFTTDRPYRWVFKCFDMFQSISALLGTPFAVGGFQLFKTDLYWKIGGYNPEELFAEDYSLSNKVNRKDFKVANVKNVYTSPRRFQKKGVFWMFQIMIKSYINRNNPQFFKEHHGYWN